VRLLLGPGAPWRASDESLRALRSHADRIGGGLHMHLLEARSQRDYAFRTFGESGVAHLERLGFLGPDLTAAHCVWPSPGDLERLAAHGVAVSHNLSSNLRLRSGLAPLPAMLEAGLTVGLGLDGLALNADDDFLSELRLVGSVHAEAGIDGWRLSAHQVLELASINGARATLGAGAPGVVEPGEPADLVLLDLRRAGGPARPGGPDPLLAVIIGGRVVLADGRFAEIDEDAVERALQRAVEEQVRSSTVDPRDALRSALRPYLLRHYAERSTS
jgi:5-methylthioadenosine/S-adenosylhomocysteine deaminase